MGIVYEDDRIKVKENGKLMAIDEHSLRKIRRFAEYFADLSLKNWELQSYRPSMIALSCCLCARMTNYVVPLFSDKLAEMTNITFNEELYECFEKLYLMYDENFKPSRELYNTIQRNTKIS